MPTSDVADVDLLALVHVAGPLEREPRDSERGYSYVQRCLRCDELLAEWVRRGDAPVTSAFAVGVLVAVDPYEGIAKYRSQVKRIGTKTRACEATPVAFL